MVLEVPVGNSPREVCLSPGYFPPASNLPSGPAGRVAGCIFVAVRRGAPTLTAASSSPRLGLRPERRTPPKDAAFAPHPMSVHSEERKRGKNSSVYIHRRCGKRHYPSVFQISIKKGLIFDKLRFN